MPNTPKKKAVKKFIRKNPSPKAKIASETKSIKVNSFSLQPHQLLPDFFDLENLIRFATLVYVLALLPVFGLKYGGREQSAFIVSNPQVREPFEAQVLGQKITQLPIPLYPDWRLSYYNNISHGGVPVVERVEKHELLDFDWGFSSPHVAINVDRFSIVYKTKFPVAKGDFYEFRALSDQGVKIYVDSGKILDQNLEENEESVETVFLSEGSHDLEVTYFEELGEARLRMGIK